MKPNIKANQSNLPTGATHDSNLTPFREAALATKQVRGSLPPRALPPAHRCSQCYLHLSACLCELIPNLLTKTRLSIIMHAIEAHKFSNSGYLACKALSNSDIHLHGLPIPVTREQVLVPGYTPLVLSLSGRSKNLAGEILDTLCSPVQLIVLDGTWPQTNRMGKRLNFLNDAPWVKIPAGRILNRPRLRSEHTRSEGMATMEAVAHAFSILESPDVGATLLQLYDLMVERWLAVRSRS